VQRGVILGETFRARRDEERICAIYIHSHPYRLLMERSFWVHVWPVAAKDLEIYYIEVEKGRDTFIVSKRITRVYYVLSGSGFFTIGDRRYDVRSGMLVEVSPKVAYSYSGKMKLIGISRPRWFNGNAGTPNGIRMSCTKICLLRRMPNPGVIFAKWLIDFYLRLNGRLWEKLPASFSTLWPVSSYDNLLHTLARKHGVRAQAPATFFLRNRPQLELIRHRAAAETNPLRVAVLGCSAGPAPPFRKDRLLRLRDFEPVESWPEQRENFTPLCD
jgi:mannose-6-phosphate isomerase-like protein (cupin superfamily)